MVTETITVRETLSSEIYSVNQTEHKLMYQATQLLLDYIHHTQKRDLSHIEDAVQYAAIDYMKMDFMLRETFELTESIRLKSKRNATLFDGRNENTNGARRLKQWIDRPLISKEQIEARLDIVDEFSAHFIERDTFKNIS